MSFVTDDKVNWRNARSKFFALNERLEAYYLNKVLRELTRLCEAEYRNFNQF